ncbi:PP2C family serine/threonine-protein phosphatase [Nonomuraea sp. NPDC000554]|uniref:PP2C family protein-serine/threonine phosphatase n=1 Tax=Nonomuraea sp. NPDC000554 TaxID=3154259 RepID=UPI0033321739
MRLAWNSASRYIELARQPIEDEIYVGPLLFAIADSKGRPAGDVATHLVIESLKKCDRWDDDIDPSDLTTVLERAIHSANESIERKIEAQAELAGMGADLVALLWSGTLGVFANIGDTQTYVVRQTDSGAAELIWTTEGHAHGMAEAGSVPEPPERIPSFLDGRSEGHAPDLVVLSLSPGDRILLCTAGLSAVVPHTLLMEILSGPGGSAEAADRLEALAGEHGGPDNIALVVIEFVDFELHREECTFID